MSSADTDEIVIHSMQGLGGLPTEYSSVYVKGSGLLTEYLLVATGVRQIADLIFIRRM
jgi:hypothetical protein